MPAVRYRHNYNQVILTTHGLAFPTKSISQNKVRVIDNGKEYLLPFMGFTDSSRVVQFHNVFIDGIVAITFDPQYMTNWIELGKSLKIGVVFNGGVYLVLDKRTGLTLD